MFFVKLSSCFVVDEWRKQRKLSFLPIPAYIAHGLHTHDKEKLRFLVMPRFGLDLHKLWLQANKKFKRETVCKIAIIMVFSLILIKSFFLSLLIVFCFHCFKNSFLLTAGLALFISYSFFFFAFNC